MISEAGERDKYGVECMSGAPGRSRLAAFDIIAAPKGPMRVTHEEAYPGIRFLPSSMNWWARLKGVPAECIHLEDDQAFMASLLPDTLYLRGKAAKRREPARPEVSLCRNCFLNVFRREFEGFTGRGIAFEPDGSSFSQYFFVSVPDFAAAGLLPEVQAAIERRLAGESASCEQCSFPATWLWISREEVPDLGDAHAILHAAGKKLCAIHAARAMCEAFETIPEANLYYVNLPYGESGAYVWF